MPIRLKALKPKETDFEPQTLGQHLKKRRAILGLSQRLAASDLGVSPFTLLNWEKGRTEPPMGCMPRILRWLAYNPFPQPKTLSERMVTVRRTNGWTIVEAARELGVDPTTWGDWERTGQVPWKRYRLQLCGFLQTALMRSP